MTIFLVKTIISIVFTASALFGAFTMLEILGRSEKRFDTGRLKKAHRVNGILFFIVFLILAGLGMVYIARTGTELSPRATFHVMLAHAVLFLFLLKLVIVKVYRQFYSKAAAMGMTITILALGTAASSTGYYVLSGGLAAKGRPVVAASSGTTPGAPIHGRKTHTPDIGKGRELFESRCLSCHDITSDSATGSPGLRGIMKRKTLPSSGRPVTAENISAQLRTPYRSMPAFPNLTREETEDIIAYMKEL